MTPVASNVVRPSQYDGVRSSNNRDGKGALMRAAGGNKRCKHQKRNQHDLVGTEIDHGDQRTRAKSCRNV